MSKIHQSANISALSDIETSIKGSNLHIGADSSIDSFVKIKFAGGLGDIIIGNRVFINSGTVVYSGNGVTIGNSVLIAANCSIAPVNHAFMDKSTLISKQGFLESRGGIVIEDDVWIGCNSVILDGSKIGRGAVIGAGSTVNGIIPEYSISVGTPAKVIGFRK